MTDEIKSLEQLAEEAGWTQEEFQLEITIIFAEMANEVLTSDARLKSFEQQFNLGDRILNIKSTLETLQ